MTGFVAAEGGEVGGGGVEGGAAASSEIESSANFRGSDSGRVEVEAEGGGGGEEAGLRESRFEGGIVDGCASPGRLLAVLSAYR